MELVFYKSFWKREWRWRLKSRNHKTIAASTEGYKNKTDCITNAFQVRDGLVSELAKDLVIK